MATDPRTAEFITGQLAALGTASARKMFGEYGLWCDGKMAAMICDDQLYLKPTPAGRALAGDLPEAPPYPGAKPHLVIEPDRWDDAEWLCALLRATADALPVPKPRRGKAG